MAGTDAATEGGGFALECPAIELRTNEQIARFYDLAPRTVQRHRKTKAPFHKPQAMEAWWEETMNGRAVPMWILSAAEKWARAEERDSRPVEPVEKLPEEKSGEAWEFDDVGLDYNSQVELQRRIVSTYARRLQEAARRGHDITKLDRLYQTALARMHQMEKEAPKLAIEQGRAWDKSEVVSVVLDISTAQNAALDQLVTRVRRAAGDEAAEVVREEVEVIKGLWSTTKFRAVEEEAADVVDS